MFTTPEVFTMIRLDEILGGKWKRSSEFKKLHTKIFFDWIRIEIQRGNSDILNVFRLFNETKWKNRWLIEWLNEWITEWMNEEVWHSEWNTFLNGNLFMMMVLWCLSTGCNRFSLFIVRSSQCRGVNQAWPFMCELFIKRIRLILIHRFVKPNNAFCVLLLRFSLYFSIYIRFHLLIRLNYLDNRWRRHDVKRKNRRAVWKCEAIKLDRHNSHPHTQILFIRWRRRRSRQKTPHIADRRQCDDESANVRNDSSIIENKYVEIQCTTHDFYVKKSRKEPNDVHCGTFICLFSFNLLLSVTTIRVAFYFPYAVRRETKTETWKSFQK